MTTLFKNELINFYKGKKVFITGHSGFKGCWLRLCLEYLGAEVFGYSLPPNTRPNFYSLLEHGNDIFGDVLDFEKLLNSMNHFQPDIVFHLAAQPLVRLSYQEPILTYQTNVIGSLNALEAARVVNSIKAFVNVTTDKCYENIEQQYKYKETDRLGGYDIYSSSKACVEILSSSYRSSFLNDNNGYILATARAGNVIGGGDWAIDRLIPDCIKSFNQNKEVELRSPNAIRPWQHVLDPLFGYILLAKRMFEEGKKYAESFNFAPNDGNFKTVEEIVQTFLKFYGSGQYRNVPDYSVHEANILMLDNEKAKNVLGWYPLIGIDEAIEMSANWYKAFQEGANMQKISLEQIERYMEK